MCNGFKYVAFDDNSLDYTHISTCVNQDYIYYYFTKTTFIITLIGKWDMSYFLSLDKKNPQTSRG